MEALKFDMEIPFWCSFGDFSSLNIKLTYPFPPLTTLFGMIQNSMGKPALHNISDKNELKKLKEQYVNDFNHLKFAVIIKDFGEKIEDFTNIHKGSRELEKNFEAPLKDIIQKLVERRKLNNKELNKQINILKSHKFYFYLIEGKGKDNDKKKYEAALKIFKENDCENIIGEIKKFWIKKSKGLDGYNLNKAWISTQINRQKIINPKYSIYITSDDDGEWSLQNIFNHLNNPKRSLYIGESDDVVNIINIEIVNINEEESNNISSVLPDIYSNTDLIKIPTNLKYNLDSSKEPYSICAIPKGSLDQTVDCYSYNGESFVFL